AEDGILAFHVTGVQTCALPIFRRSTFARCCSRISGPIITLGSAGSPIFQCEAMALAVATNCARTELCTRKRVSRAQPWPQLTLKIGRASCRARVEISGGEFG